MLRPQILSLEKMAFWKFELLLSPDCFCSGVSTGLAAQVRTPGVRVLPEHAVPKHLLRYSPAGGSGRDGVVPLPLLQLRQLASAVVRAELTGPLFS